MKQVTKYSAALVLLSSLAITGCGGKEKALVGHYKGSMTMPASKADDPAAKMGEAMMKGMMNSLSLDLKEDKTFTMSMIFPMEGTWAYADDKVTLTMTKAMGMSVDDLKKQNPSAAQTNKPMIFSVGADGSLSAVPDAAKADQGSLTFTKEAK